ncbi:MAG: hypothetical protein WEB03_02785 [Nitriliruptor sp.]|uniref:hypothetical protein n=1 Tax=Nitriliruptor sp. TaxID=2448056 RepID=UPI0034A0769A
MTAGLARSTRAELDLAWQHREVLVAAATTLVTTAGHDPDLGVCAAADCGLATLSPDPALCGVADRLARVPGAPPGVHDLPVEVALAGFLAALTAAADAIRHCRQAEHIGSSCWFSPVAGLDGCGDVLRLLHRCG